MNEIRPLCASDRDDILEIARHTWDGHDYLPYFFDSWLSDPDAHTAAIEEDGHVIALANLRVIDHGSTGWMEGLRVHPDHRGKGIASLLTEHVVQKAKDLHLKRVRYTTAADNTVSLHLAQDIGMEKKFELVAQWHDEPTIESYQVLNEPIEHITVDQLSLHLPLVNLLPHNIIVYDWKALEATRENLHKMSLFCDFWVQQDEGLVKSLSLGFSGDAESGKLWYYTIYAPDVARFTDHLSHHITLAKTHDCTTTAGIFPVQFQETLEIVTCEEQDGVPLVLLEKSL